MADLNKQRQKMRQEIEQGIALISVIETRLENQVTYLGHGLITGKSSEALIHLFQNQLIPSIQIIRQKLDMAFKQFQSGEILDETNND